MNLDDRYLIWQPMAVKRAYAVQRFDTAFLKRVAGSLAAVWPAGIYCVLDAERRMGDPCLTDSLLNADHQLLISPRLKKFLERAAGPDIEYWPLKVIDRTGRPLSEPYYFVHFLNAPDCLDLAACGATRSRILPHLAEKVQRLWFKSDPSRELCRPKTFGKVTLVSWTLGASLAAEGFTGFRLMGLFDYGVRGDLPPHPKRHLVDALRPG